MLWATATPAQTPTQAQQYFLQGRQYHLGEGGKKVDVEKALRYYLQALRADPQFYEAHVNAGKSYYARKDYVRAIKHFNAAIISARGRDDISAQAEARISSDMGGCYYKAGKLADAEKWFRGAVGLDPSLVEAHYNLINLLFSDEREEEAIRQMAIATEAAPSERYGIFRGRQATQESKAESDRRGCGDRRRSTYHDRLFLARGLHQRDEEVTLTMSPTSGYTTY